MSDTDYDHFEPYIPDGHVLCPRCYGSMEVDCRCGGDQCYCDNHGDKPCPFCGGEYGGEGYVPKEKADRYYARQAEIHAAFRAGMADK